MIQQKIMGRIVKSLGGFYYVAPQSGGPVVECRARGAFRQQNIKPCVGDWATVELTEQGTGYVVQLEPRSNSLVRPPLANLDQLVLGDFDSYAGVVQSDCELLRYPIEKDDTDTMLAVKQALQRGYERLVLVGMLGGRLDHTLANIQTLVYAVEHGAAAQIIDSSCYITVIKGGQTAQIPYQQGFHFSVFCHSDCASGVCIRHAKYELEDAQLTNGFPIGVSNSFLEGQPAQISVKQGILVILSTGGD